MSPAERAAAAALAAVGVRFRLHGRDPAFGLDCVGLAALAARAAEYSGAIPADYALRNGDAARAMAMLDGAGLTRAATPAPGDILLFRSGPGQLHLAVAVTGGIVHADASLRRVVRRPGPPPWPMLGCWRFEER